jgi:hypothetical protein
MTKYRQEGKILASSKKLNWHSFNFLENLFAFCPHPNRMVDKENGIHFRITKPSGEKALCVLFRIDRASDPLIRKGKRPDYMVLHVEKSKCIITIIEMKGERDAAESVAQISAFYDLLRRELQAHTPSKFHFIYQGIILCAPNSQVPLPLLIKTQRQGLPIAVLRHPHKAELYPYISRVNSLQTKYEHKAIREIEPDCFLEQLFVLGAMNSRKECGLHSQYFCKDKERSGMYIDYQNPIHPSKITLIVNMSRALLGVSKEAEECLFRLQNDIKEIGIEDRLQLITTD